MIKPLALLTLCAVSSLLGDTVKPAVTHIKDLCIHDPQILADKATQTYYIYGQYSPKRNWLPPISKHGGVLTYSSKDLIHWEGPRMVFEVPEDFWCDKFDAPWAPEVHAYRDKYYLFVTFNDWTTTLEKREGRPPITKRAAQILVGDSPVGPFKPFANTPHTPPGDMTLDATFWEEDGQPWMIYCREWIQITHGTVEAIRLKPDLSATVGEPLQLITSADVDWPRRDINYKGTTRYPGIVTDGPYLHRTSKGTLVLLWSSWSKTREYATTLAYSPSGKLAGPWKHLAEPILQDDVGHGGFFETFDGKLMLVIHRYFHQPLTRVQIYEMEDTGELLRVKGQVFGAP